MKNMTNSTLLLLALLAGITLAPSANAFFKCMPIYGNWCGPGHPATGFPPPVDGFDAACMRHDLCSSGPIPGGACDYAFAGEVRSLAAQLGYMPRPIQWAEYAIRVKSGGPWGDMPMPTPWDAMGVLSSLASPCW